jgi:hypothetical protein
LRAVNDSLNLSPDCNRGSAQAPGQLVESPGHQATGEVVMPTDSCSQLGGSTRHHGPLLIEIAKCRLITTRSRPWNGGLAA